MAVVKIVDSAGFSNDLFSGYLEGVLLNDRSGIVFHDKGNATWRNAGIGRGASVHRWREI